jgi:hypothetical protein
MLVVRTFLHFESSNSVVRHGQRLILVVAHDGKG